MLFVLGCVSQSCSAFLFVHFAEWKSEIGEPAENVAGKIELEILESFQSAVSRAEEALAKPALDNPAFAEGLLEVS